MLDSIGQRISDRAGAIRKNGWLSELELETIRRRIVQEVEETHRMVNNARSADMDRNVVDELEDFVANETEDIPPEERTII